MKLKQERHGARRRLPSRALLGSLVLATAGLGACADNHGEDSPELQAILQDGELTQFMTSALMAAPGKPGPGGTGTGGATTGAAGTSGSSSGTAGSFATGMAGVGGPGPGTGAAGMSGPPVPTRNLPGEAQGFWRFDDCNMSRTELSDNSFSGNHTAFRSVTASLPSGRAELGHRASTRTTTSSSCPTSRTPRALRGLHGRGVGQAGGARRCPHDLPQASGRHEHVRARRERQELPDRDQPRQRQGGRRAGSRDARHTFTLATSPRPTDGIFLKLYLERGRGRLEARRQAGSARRRGPAAHGQRRQQLPASTASSTTWSSTRSPRRPPRS